MSAHIEEYRWGHIHGRIGMDRVPTFSYFREKGTRSCGAGKGAHPDRLASRQLVCPPAKWFHQHFKPGKAPARYLALKPWGFTYQVEDLVKTLEVEAAGGTQIDYRDQDPDIHQTFIQECAKRGVEVRLKF